MKELNDMILHTHGHTRTRFGLPRTSGPCSISTRSVSAFFKVPRYPNSNDEDTSNNDDDEDEDEDEDLQLDDDAHALFGGTTNGNGNNVLGRDLPI